VLFGAPDNKHSPSRRAAPRNLPHPFFLLLTKQSNASCLQAGEIQGEPQSSDRFVVWALRLTAFLLCAGFWTTAITLLI